MANKGKDEGSKSILEKNDSGNNVETKATISELVNMNVEDPTTIVKGEDKEENKKEEVNNEQLSRENSKGKVKKLRKRKKKNTTSGNTNTVVAIDVKKPESSTKKAKKRVEGSGMIFMCSSKTKKDCYRYKVLGLPASKKDVVSKVYKGMRLFLFDIDLRLMYGIYKATAPGGYNIEPKAFKSVFPSQVRFTVLEDCLPLAEEEFRKVIKDNYYTRNKFNCQLKSEQVKKLCKLFQAGSKRPKFDRVGRSSRVSTHTFVDRDRIKPRDREDEEHLPLDGRSFMHEREGFAPPGVPAPRLPLPPVPAPAPPPLYAYERPVEMDAYRRDTLLEHRDLRKLDQERRLRDEIVHRDPYSVYNEPPPSYREPAYSVGLPPRYRSEYYPAAVPPPEYSPVSPPPRYHLPAAVPPPEYQPRSPRYHLPASVPPPEYHPRSPRYHLPAAVAPPEYQPRSSYRY
ncbi:uncharacterized protein LOC131147840 [Malania oleifera]|uniref:uncharacterized protein LOC131147840 n=1 Tax=Malania oleifera TaxID=397392 RepID=UPI0025AE1311|nr:uncharacterized protein LOC131147840 [Malania oleifera]XP_057953434.1 uncharacterized protein LOC131147840 [Malania oleifera]